MLSIAILLTIAFGFALIDLMSNGNNNDFDL